MYIKVLDVTEGRVHKYDVDVNDSFNRVDWPDSEAIEKFLVGEGHRLSDCEWMSHADGEIIIDKAEI